MSTTMAFGMHSATYRLPVMLLYVGASLAGRCYNKCHCDDLRYFRKINCSDSKLTKFPEISDETWTITTLDMTRNILKELRSKCLSLPQLLVLRLQNNLLGRVDKDAFRGLPAIMVLQLSDNNIKHLDKDVFHYNTRLDWLDVSGNHITLPQDDIFLKPIHLRRLDLAANNLQTIPIKTFDGLSSINYLSLANNTLPNIAYETLKMLDSLTHLFLGKNPLRCDCLLVDTWKWTKQKEILTDTITCREPIKMQNRPWDHLTDLDCKHEPVAVNTYILYIMAGFLLLIFVMVVLVMVQLRHRRLSLKHSTAAAAARKPNPMPIGEYIEILADQQYSGEYERTETMERYVKGLAHSSYITPICSDEEPTYANIKGPPLPMRSPSMAVTDPTTPAPPTPTRRCSIPLLEGCDFYEVVD